MRRRSTFLEFLSAGLERRLEERRQKKRRVESRRQEERRDTERRGPERRTRGALGNGLLSEEEKALFRDLFSGEARC